MGGGERRCREVSADDVIAYANHVSFTTNGGIRWFSVEGKPLHPPSSLDPRFLPPYPQAHVMRQQGGMFSHASKRKAQPRDEGEGSKAPRRGGKKAAKAPASMVELPAEEEVVRPFLGMEQGEEGAGRDSLEGGQDEFDEDGNVWGDEDDVGVGAGREAVGEVEREGVEGEREGVEDGVSPVDTRGGGGGTGQRESGDEDGGQAEGEGGGGDSSDSSDIDDDWEMDLTGGGG